MEIIYSPEQLRQTAEFINEKNKLIRETVTPEHIMENALRGIKGGASMTGTAGYYILFSYEEDDTVYLEFLVDVTVSKDTRYISARMQYGS